MIIKFTSKTMGDVLTEKQELVLKIIRNWYLENGEAPSLSELQESLSISTKRGVVNHLIALEKKGYIFRTSKPRGIHMVDSDDEVVYDYLVGIPVLGYANAGTPLVSAEEENIGVLKIDRSLVGKKKNLFSLIVKGDSMNLASIEDKCIEEGNYVIVQKDSEINDGDIVVAIIENSATVKRIKKAKDMIVLYPQSSNPENQPIFLDKDTESIINGKVIKVLENPSI
ncbi:MAG: transcriptional repressor LexA [Candidatus Dojkabacteria bacterium]|jgi:repressor LexA|nr:transcriptional repressor LexA [Candidatus Dojkabacteria bacterium]MDD4561195.1 transcriptional repressor LexA [Candidatus Dojkabacteria bacterium]NLB12100.1 repressor LexA [Candidatus Dojkabacteria bacterium]